MNDIYMCSVHLYNANYDYIMDNPLLIFVQRN